MRKLPAHALYPMRYGTLSGMFTILLEEASMSKLTPARVAYWKNRFRAIDTIITEGDNGQQLETTNNDHNSSAEGGEMKMNHG